MHMRYYGASVTVGVILAVESALLVRVVTANEESWVSCEIAVYEL